MKTKFHYLFIILVLFAGANRAAAQGTAFTYQGQLQNNGSPASGTYNLTFSLFNTNTTGVAITGPVTNSDVMVTNGLFTVLIDFGSDAFIGETNWLEIAVETNGFGSFTTLTPRQELTPTPYAIYAESANDLSGTLSASQLTSIGNTNSNFGNFFVGPAGNSTTSGSGLTANGFEALANNTSGSDNTANGYAALLANTSGSDNTANGLGALFANTSGSQNTANGMSALNDNTNGIQNTANGFQALQANTSGSQNTADGMNALVSNTTGTFNTANGVGALSSNTNGSQNVTSGYQALFANTSGSNNIAVGFQAGYNNSPTASSNIDIGNAGVSTDANIIRIGTSQSSTYIAGVINGNGGGLGNLNVSASQLSSIGNTNSFGNFFVGPSGNSTMDGYDNTAIGYAAFINNQNGIFDTANGFDALEDNTSGYYDTANGVSALQENTSGSYDTANGTGALEENTNGSYNTADGYSTLYSNTSGNYNIAQGFGAGENITTGSSNIDIGNPGASTDTNIIRIGTSQTSTYIAGVINGNGAGLINLSAAQLSGVVPATVLSGFQSPNYATVGGGEDNIASGQYATVGGGQFNTNFSIWSTIGGGDNSVIGAGGLDNTIGGGGGNLIDINNSAAAIAGGSGNQILASDANSFIGGGYLNKVLANSVQSTISGGYNNTNSANYATIGGGYQNAAGYPYATVGGGQYNTASGNAATVAGGYENTALGAYSFAAGNNAQAVYARAFVWSDGSATTTSTAGDQFMVRASGGVVIYSSSVNTAGVSLAAGSGTWASLSDRNAKDGFAPVTAQQVLAKVAALPLTTWSYKTEPGVRHMGPMAQDFYAAFDVGEDNKHITTVDEEGVALAAIQGLNQKLNEKDAEIQNLEKKLDELQAAVNQLAAQK